MKIKKLKDLMGKNLTMDELLNFMADAAIKEVERKKFKQTERPRPSQPPVVARTPSASVKREVYKRDKCCTKCGSLKNLNYDHREAYALGGDSTTKNIRLLCFNCNQRSHIPMRL